MFKKALLASATFACALGFSAATFAAPITVDPSDFVATNGTVVPDTFGDTADIDFTWSVLGTTMRKWNGGYSGQDAFYCGTNPGAVCFFDLAPLGGASLTLNSFDLGGWLNEDRVVAWSVADLFNPGFLLVSGIANVPGTSPLTVPVGLASSDGFRVSFGPDGFNGGLTSLTYTISESQPGPTPVPAPGTLGLLALGLLGLGAALRRRATA